MDEHVREIKYVKVHLERDDILEKPKESFFETVRKAQIEAFKEGIKANTIVINENMVKVDAFQFRSIGGFGLCFSPTMFCGMNVVLTNDELPDGYSFAIFEGTTKSDRLSEFESIGMSPDELRKAAKLYRYFKDLEEGLV